MCAHTREEQSGEIWNVDQVRMALVRYLGPKWRC